MKILFIVPIMGCGGAEILLGSIARNLVKKGHNVHIVCLGQFHHTWDIYPDKEAFSKEVPITIIGGSVRFGLLKLPVTDNEEYIKYVNAFKPDIIHSHLYQAELLSRSYIKNGVTYFSHAHDNMPQLQRFGLQTVKSRALFANYRERSWLIKQYRKCGNRFIAISLDVKAYLEKNLPASFRKKINYLPNAIDTKRFFTERDYLHSQEESFHIVSIANLVPKKNHILLVEVMKILKARGDNVTMEVLGFGPLMDMLVTKTKEYGLEELLFFRGSVGDVPQRLKNADLYVHPASYEPFGLVLLEAMASGLPVVSLDGYGNRELMKEGENGFMLPANATPEMFAEKILRLMKNVEEREQMGRNAREFSLNYDIDNYTGKLLDIYSAAKPH